MKVTDVLTQRGRLSVWLRGKGRKPHAMQPKGSLLESQLAHLIPKGRAGDAQQCSSLGNFAAGLAHGILDMQTFGTFAHLGETGDALAGLLKQCLFGKDEVS
jgi:hypothetical protein